MRTTKNMRHSEYRIIKNGSIYKVWLISYASGAKLKCVADHFEYEESAKEFIKWLVEREK